MSAREEEGSWSRLPDEISERVLSFLPVPVLCRCRSVCRQWNELVRKQSFLDLCDLNGGNREYLFVTRYLTSNVGPSVVDNACWRTTCFLDLDERRWYSIPTDAPSEYEMHHLAMDGGLVCGLSASDQKHKLVMLDPVAKTRRELPASTTDGKPICCNFGTWSRDHDDLPEIVTVVDNADHSFEVFLMNRDCKYVPLPGLSRRTGFFVYESSVDAWQALEIQAETSRVRDLLLRGKMGESAVLFQGNLYAVCEIDGRCDSIIVSYNPEENMWREVLADELKNPEDPHLIVSGNRMFLDFAHSTDDTDFFSNFEIREIFVDDNSSTSVVKFSMEDLEDILGEDVCGIQYGFPLDSNSLVLISRWTGRVLTYDLRSGAVADLPAHPLSLPEEDSTKVWVRRVRPHYRARLSTLSLRNIL